MVKKSVICKMVFEKKLLDAQFNFNQGVYREEIR